MIGELVRNNRSSVVLQKSKPFQSQRRTCFFFSKLSFYWWQNITLSKSFQDVNFELLKECFVVLISAYNLLLKNKHYYSHLDVKWVTYMFISQKKKKVPSSGSSLSVDSEWKKTLTVLHLFPHLKFLRWVRFARVGLLALCSGRPPSRSLRVSIKSHKCNGILGVIEDILAASLHFLKWNIW